jgi:hypothetical protein
MSSRSKTASASSPFWAVNTTKPLLAKKSSNTSSSFTSSSTTKIFFPAFTAAPPQI